MDQNIEKLHAKIDKIDERLDEIDKHLAVYNNQLEIHIKRSELLEQDIKPIKAHIYQVKGAGILLALLSTIVGLIAAVKSI